MPDARWRQGHVDMGDVLAAAAKGFEKSQAGWRKVLDKYPSAIADKNVVDELRMTIDLYQQTLEKQGKKLPADFILRDVLDRN